VGDLLRSYSTPNLTPPPKKRERVFVVVLTAFFTLAKIFIIILTEIYFTTLWEEKRSEVYTLSLPPQNHNNN